MRPGYNQITVDFYRRPWTNEDSVEMRVISLPIDGYEGKRKAIIDRTSKVSLSEYEDLWQMAVDLRIEDIAKDFDSMGVDGLTCTIAYGGFHTSVALTAWSPDHEPEQRGLGPFNEVCKAFTRVGGLTPSRIF
jgi:hypothetical protein